MKTYNYHTAHKSLLGDTHTPVSVYLKVRDLYHQSVLMESSDYHSSENNRSFIGLCPIASVAVSHGKALLTFPDKQTTERDITPLYTAGDAISEFISSFKIKGEYASYCGAYGYTSFSAVRYFENIDIKDSYADVHDAPDILYIVYKYIIVFKDSRQEMTLIELLDNTETDSLNSIEQEINKHATSSYAFTPVGDIQSTLTDNEHRENISKGIAHCLRGDVFQIVISRRFIQQFSGDDFMLYRSLRSINPSPYLFYFDFGGYRIFGSSPETHCRIEDGMAYIDPIAGTTKRTGDKQKDQELATALLADPKENAEHVMLVDLARNDLSRNCTNVKVDFYREIQYYSHVIHLVSRVSGKLNPNVNPINAFIDTFPAGTLSGAPKVRAMQLISEYEPHNRGAYGGCIGFIGFDGNLNQAITIRTFVSRNNQLWFQAGGGIVAKSNVENELQEVNNKLGALRRAIAVAGELQ
ncbi:MAG: anthranilate synthase component I family protein [Marinifilaceae bacterium]